LKGFVMVASLLGMAALALFQEDSQQSANDFIGAKSLLAPESPGEIEFNLAPSLAPVRKPSKARGEVLIDDAELIELVTRLVRSAGVRDDFKLETKDNAIGVVGGSQARQEVTRVVGVLEDALISEERLEIRILSLAAGAETGSDAVVIDEAEADRRETAITQSKRGRVARVGVAHAIDGMVASIDEVDTRRVVRGYSAEVGVVPLAIDPLNDTEVEGLKAAFWTARVSGATLVDLALCYSEPAAPTRELQIEPTLWYVEPRRAAAEAGGAEVGARMFHGKAPFSLALPIDRFVSLAGNFVIPDGQSLWLPVRVATKGAPSSLIVEARVRGFHRPLIEPLTRANDSPQLTLVRLAALESIGFDRPDYEPSSFEEHVPVAASEGEARWDSAKRWPAELLGRPRTSALLGLAPGIAPFELGGAEVTATWLQTQNVVLESPAPITEALSTRFAETLRAPESVVLQGRILRGGEPAAEFRLPIVIDRSATIWSGNQGATLRRWDVEVADIEQVGIPIVVSYLDGFALTFFASSIGEGHLQLTATGVVSLVEQPPTRAEVGNPETPVYETMKSRRLFVDGAATVVPGEKPAAIRIGGSSLALEVTVVAR
jgi:hypothetical protein